MDYKLTVLFILVSTLTLSGCASVPMVRDGECMPGRMALNEEREVVVPPCSAAPALAYTPVVDAERMENAAQYQTDLRACRQLAHDHIEQHSSLLADLLTGGILGAATGAATGAIVGEAGTGAAAGATYGGIFSAARGHMDKKTAAHTIVRRCLEGRGHAVLY